MISNLILILMLNLIPVHSGEDLPTVKEVDLNRYAGTWYEIARLPNNFEKGLECVTATYTPGNKGKIAVLNKGFSSKKGKYKSARGTAWVPDEKYPGRLKVSFFWPFAGNYYIITLDEEYRFALVGDPSRKYLWILSRTPELTGEIRKELIQVAEKNGFDTGAMVKVEHDCEP